MVYLPTFTFKINQMKVNMPYMNGMGYVIKECYIIISLSTFKPEFSFIFSGGLFLRCQGREAPRSVFLPEGMLG